MVGHVMAGKTLTIFLAADLKKFNSGMSQAQGGLKGLTGSLKNMLGPALIGAGAALGAFATQMAIDGVQAAIDDEAALNKLATTLDNLGLSHDQPMVENFIGTLERATGVADDELRPAYDRLVRSIGDTATANDMLKLSMDISAGTGKSLQAVTEALGKAYDGNTGGLSRLGAGIDAAILKTGDMDKITAALSATFKGQAATSAATYEGQVKRLSQAADNLKEAFGKGLLDGLGNTNDSTQNLVDVMEDAEESVGDLARAAGLLVNDLVDLVPLLDKNAKGSEKAGDEQNILTTATKLYVAQLGLFIPLFAPIVNGYIDQSIATRKAANSTNFLIGQIAALRLAQTQGIFASNEAAYQARIAAEAADLLEEETDDLLDTTVNTTTATNEYAKAEENLTSKYEKRLTTMDASAAKLTTEIGKLQEARRAVDEYIVSTSKSINTVNLESIFGGSVGEDGKLIAGDFIKNFNTAVDQAPWFGNVLNALKQRGVDQRLIEELASLGPGIGGGIGQAALDDPGGLLETLKSKWPMVQETMKTLAMGLVPEGLLAGEATAIATVDAMSAQLVKDTGRLNKLGKNIGKAVGVSFKAQLLSDIAEAIAEVEASATAARAERVASAARQQIAITNTQIAQAVQLTLQQADARNGLPSRPIFI
jgi:hypothetical protein